jgi:hypothetical protein
MDEENAQSRPSADAEDGHAGTKKQVDEPAVALHLREPAYAIVLN